MDRPNTSEATPAAQYVRMSTDHQRYSIDNQIDAIREFAEVEGYRLVRTYADPGRSGLTLKGRPGLQRLLADVQAGEAPFKALLVYYVSRWGRFQDPDESPPTSTSAGRAAYRSSIAQSRLPIPGAPMTPS